MSIEQSLHERNGSKCELCQSDQHLSVYEIPPVTTPTEDNCILLCKTCVQQINSSEALQANHWHCLNDSMWSPVPAVQVMAWRILNRLSNEGWAQNLLDMLYLEEDMLAWAKSDTDSEDTAEAPTLDSNGTPLQAGDTVTVIKDLVVKGANFTAKRGTSVRNISLTNNPEHIEGRVNGVRIVLLSCYLKKSN